jgi:signal transduction histidine kinase
MRFRWIFILLLGYILLQFSWWTYLLIDLNNEVYEHKIENVRLRYPTPDNNEVETQALARKLNQKHWMVIGEGSIFLIILLTGGIIAYRSFNKEFQLARQQKNFLLSVTHEYKSPLASIKLMLETLLKHDIEKEKRNSLIKSAIKDTDRLNALVENALLAASIEQQTYRFNLETVDISKAVSDLVNTFQSNPDRKHSIETDIENNIEIKADTFAFSLLLNNLLENAAKYSPKDSVIKVELRKTTGGKVVMRVLDQGIGISEADKKKIFDKFYRAGNEETRSAKGTGLGLYIARHIAEYHNGKITVQNNSPKGSIFEVTI